MKFLAAIKGEVGEAAVEFDAENREKAEQALIDEGLSDYKIILEFKDPVRVIAL